MSAQMSICVAGGEEDSDHGYCGAYGRISAGTARLETGERGGMGTEDCNGISSHIAEVGQQYESLKSQLR